MASASSWFKTSLRQAHEAHLGQQLLELRLVVLPCGRAFCDRVPAGVAEGPQCVLRWLQTCRASLLDVAVLLGISTRTGQAS